MSPSPSSHDSSARAALERDLSLVVPGIGWAKDMTARAFIKGKPTELPAALDHAASLIRASKVPAIVGLSRLSIEAIREAVALAETMRGRLLPWPPNDGALRLPVTQTATLGHLFACRLAVWIGCASPSAGTVAAAIAARVPDQIDAEPTLAAVMRLREALRSSAPAEQKDFAVGFLAAGRVAVILTHDCDPRLVSQWHKFAADVQRRVRVAVFTLPHPRTANARGATEVVAWQTGVDISGGGVDFSDGPRKVMDRMTADLIVDARDMKDRETASVSGDQRVIAIGDAVDDKAEVSFVTSGLALGLAARVMRCDGVVLWLCDDPAPGNAPPDPAVVMLSGLTQRVGSNA